MNEELAKYLAGLLDADGSISFNFVNPNKGADTANLSLKVSLTSSSAVDAHGFVYSLPTLTKFGSSDRHGNKDQFMRWTVTSRADLEMLIPRLVKHMVVKAGHFQRMLDRWRGMRGVALSVSERDELKEFSASSRLQSGPLKPKNHPSWAWLAGYLDGNGSYRSTQCKSGFYNGKQAYRQQMSINAACHVNDVEVLDFIRKAHGGYIRPHSKSPNCMVWERGLSKKDSSFALNFLRELVGHSRLKRHKIEQLIAFHHSQRLSGQSPAG